MTNRDEKSLTGDGNRNGCGGWRWRGEQISLNARSEWVKQEYRKVGEVAKTKTTNTDTRCAQKLLLNEFKNENELRQEERGGRKGGREKETKWWWCEWQRTRLRGEGKWTMLKADDRQTGRLTTRCRQKQAEEAQKNTWIQNRITNHACLNQSANWANSYYFSTYLITSQPFTF